MVGTAAVGAGVVTVAASDALVTPFLTDVEGKCLRVLGDVGRNSVFANASVCQRILGSLAWVLGECWDC